MGDTGKVWLVSDIFDTLWHRCEISVNQVPIPLLEVYK